MAERPFNWASDCIPDVGRLFPPVAGKGRGLPLPEALEEARKQRQMRERKLTEKSAEA